MSYQNKRRGGYHQQRGGGNKFYGGGPSRRAHLEVGQRGFLCTCNNFEKECNKEAMNLLNEYADRLFGAENWRQTGQSEQQDQAPAEGDNAAEKEAVEDDDEEEDISVALKKEIDGMKQEYKRPVRQQRFREVASGAKNVLFICSSVPDPALLVHTLLTDLKTSKMGRSRFLVRLLPVQVTCKAYLDDISLAAGPLFDKYFAEGNKTFSVIFKSRNNNNLGRDAVIDLLANLVSLKNATNHANLSQPQLVVMVEVIKNICCLSVLSDYFELSKYNLLEIVAPPKPEKIDSQTEGAEVPDEEKQGGENVAAEAGSAGNNEASPACDNI